MNLTSNLALSLALAVSLGLTLGIAPSRAQTPAPTAPTAPSSSQLPNLGDGADLTLSAERRMGDRIAREIYRDPDYLDDPVLVDYVQSIWQPLLAAARLRGDLSPELDERFAWEFMLGRDRTVNAFALPGGYLGLHLGLMAVVSSRDELASVLGHELSHVTQRHISRLISKQAAQTPWAIGAMILGALAASKSAQAANALVIGGQAVAAQNQLNFSRDMEREADRVGYGVMTQAGFEPQGFVTMFDKLQQASRLNDSGAFPYLRSHPLTTERIADMQARLPLISPSASPPAPPSAQAIAHGMLAARARVLSNPAVDALRDAVRLAAPADLAAQALQRQAATLYGAALAAMKLRDFPAMAALQARLTDVTRDYAPAARLARLLGAEQALATGNVRQALALLDSGAGGSLASAGSVPASAASAGLAGPAGSAAPSQTGSARPEVLLRAQALTQSGQAAQPAQAAQLLQTWVTNHPRDAQAWQLLSSAYAAQGQTLRAIRADAEAQVAHMDYAGATERFKAAQELARELARKPGADHIEASIIDTRARQVALLLREQTAER